MSSAVMASTVHSTVRLPDVVYASLYYGQVFRSDDGGNAFPSRLRATPGTDQNAAGMRG